MVYIDNDYITVMKSKRDPMSHDVIYQHTCANACPNNHVCCRKIHKNCTIWKWPRKGPTRLLIGSFFGDLKLGIKWGRNWIILFLWIFVLQYPTTFKITRKWAREMAQGLQALLLLHKTRVWFPGGTWRFSTPFNWNWEDPPPSSGLCGYSTDMGIPTHRHIYT